MEQVGEIRSDGPIPVLIVGGGSVGLALAAELGRLGVGTLVVEETDGTLRHPRASELNARTMELCRRWDIADRVRQAGIPSDFPNAALFVTSFSGHEIARIERQWHGVERDFPLGPERPKRCNQLWFNPIVADYVAAQPSVALRLGCRFEKFSQDGDGVSAVLRGLASGAPETVRARYLVACCGGDSSIPAALGETPDENSVLDHSLNIFFRAEALWDRHDKGAASLNFFIDDTGLWGGMSTQNGRELWRLTVHGTDAGVADADPDACLGRMFGAGFDYEIINVVPWTRRGWVAERFQDGRVVLAGDAAHQCSPTGGFGFNTGMGDAIDLAWKLHAALAGWAGPGLLASYGAERRPVAQRNIGEATANFDRYTLPDTAGINGDGAAGAALRRQIGGIIAESRARQFLSDGIALGYRYDPSPIVWPDGGNAPPDEVSRYVPTARPGHRAPHAWLADGRSILDLFGDGFVLLRLGDAPPDSDRLTAEAAKRGMPLSVVDIDDPDLFALYERRLVLVRPDGHVAWRGDAAPDHTQSVIDRVTGAS